MKFVVRFSYCDVVYCPKHNTNRFVNERQLTLWFESLVDVQLFINNNNNLVISSISVVYDEPRTICLSHCGCCGLPFDTCIDDLAIGGDDECLM